MNWVELLEAWAAGWLAADRLSPGLELFRSPDYVDKRASWVILENAAASGQVTVWETGECDWAFGLFEGDADPEVSSLVLSTASELSDLLERVSRRVASSE
jgi:hypothetical protein